MKNLNKSLNYINDPDTKKTIKDILYKINIYIKAGKSFNTGFLSPTEFNYAEDLLNNHSVDYFIFDTGSNSERRIISVDEEEDIIQVYRINNNTSNIEHRDVLGTLISLGISRNKIGDIVVGDDVIEFAAMSECYNDIIYGLKNIKNTPVSAELKKVPIINYDEEKLEIKTGSLSSLRLDSFIALALNLSRNKAQNLVRSGRVKINHEISDAVDSRIETNDEISVSRVGRFGVLEIGGKSRKGRTFIKYFKRVN